MHVLQVQQLIAKTVEQLGGVDIMVANAGGLGGKRVHSDEETSAAHSRVTAWQGLAYSGL